MKSKGNLEIFSLEDSEEIILNPVSAPLLAGGYNCFPSAALDFPDEAIDFMKFLVKDKETTFVGRISGDSLNELGILDGDWCLIDKSLEPVENNLVAATIDGQFFTKRFKPKYTEKNKIRSLQLKSANPDYQDFDISEETEFFLWGIVTWTFRNWRKL